MKIRIVFIVVAVLFVGQISCARTISQKDIDKVHFTYENALKVLQGRVMAGAGSESMSGSEFVERGLASHAYLLQGLADYYVTAEVQQGGGKKRVILLLCDKQDGYALLEGVLCKNDKFIEERWQETPKHPCDFSIRASELCQ